MPFLPCCLSLSVVNLPQVPPFCGKVCTFLSQVYRKFFPLYRKSTANMLYSATKSVLFCNKFTTSLVQYAFTV